MEFFHTIGGKAALANLAVCETPYPRWLVSDNYVTPGRPGAQLLTQGDPPAAPRGDVNFRRLQDYRAAR
jgi:hypothetical protein